MTDYLAGRPQADHRRMPGLVLANIDTTPMVLAVEVLVAGRWWPGRASEWRRDDHGWHVFVITEQAVAGQVDIGWVLVDDLVRPARHEVRTTHADWRWGTWSPPDWPAELARFAAAGSNLSECPADHPSGLGRRAVRPSGGQPFG